MLIIGHRGAAGLGPENSLEAFQAGIDAGADILEFDVQRTKDGELLVVHDSTLFRTHSKATVIRWSSHASILAATKNGHQIATLREVMDRYFGKVLLNLEIKQHGIAKDVITFLDTNYITTPRDWQLILISSFKPRELVVARRLNNNTELAMLHDKNPFTFMLYHRRLNLTAVGFHKLRAQSLAIEVAKQLGLFIYIYTVNSGEAARWAKQRGIDGIVTDNPKLLRKELK